MNDPLLRYRERFPILSRTKYLVSHSLGAMPEATRDALVEYADLWASRGVRAWGDRWWMMSIEVGDIIAPLIGAPPGSVVMLPNVTTAEAVVLSSFDYDTPRNRVVIVDGEFPSVRYIYDRLARRLGAEIVTVPHDSSGLGFDLDRLLAAIDERTQIVPIGHILFESSYMIDVEAITKRCREVGATLVLDVFQSAGIVPVDVTGWDVPIAVGGVLKWLCGGPGGSFLYVDPKLRPKLEPSFTGWMAHANPFGFEPPPMRFRDDALRFALGTPPIPALYAAREGPKVVAEACGGDMQIIREKSLRQTQRIIDLADARGFELRTPREADRRGGSVSVLMPHAKEVAYELNAEDIVCDFRPGAGVRFSPHFYTTDEEIEIAFATVDEILRTDRWKRQAEKQTIVT
ncbi:MAG: aminotransferase class V-fold PLP-dependent enzyme [Acidobacteria bacterium]|nr:aminotransferase class V-fold PLP-dependent enzyme [Acidobacteriota bacterium]MBV9188304.1 aminotransferase class V-fold PLP-dependent enzyme [Acidobacteriota bacterium]